MAEVIVTLCKENDSETKYYPNIKTENIPDNAVTLEKLNDDVALTSAEIDEICN